MKITRNSLLILGFGFSIFSIEAQEQTDPYKKPSTEQATTKVPGPVKQEFNVRAANIRVTTEWIDMNTADAMQLMRSGLAPNSPELIQKIRKLEDQGKAAVVDAQSIVMRVGVRAAAYGAKEFIYASDYEEISIPKANDKNKTENAASLPVKEDKAPTQPMIVGTLAPNGFQKRDVGGKLEVEASMGADSASLIDITFAPEYTIFTGWQNIGKVLINGNIVPMVEQPLFAASRCATHVVVDSGETLVVQMTSVQKEDGTIDLNKKRLLLVQAAIFWVPSH